MCKLELFTKIVEIVSNETEMPPEAIMSESKENEIVDARYMLVYHLFRAGFHPSWIARHIGKTVRSVTFILSHFAERLEHGGLIVRMENEKIRNRIRSILL